MYSKRNGMNIFLNDSISSRLMLLNRALNKTSVSNSFEYTNFFNVYFEMFEQAEEKQLSSHIYSEYCAS